MVDQLINQMPFHKREKFWRWVMSRVNALQNLDEEQITRLSQFDLTKIDDIIEKWNQWSEIEGGSEGEISALYELCGAVEDFYGDNR